MPNPLKEGADTRVYIDKKFLTVVKEVLSNHYMYQSCNLLGPYHIFEY